MGPYRSVHHALRGLLLLQLPLRQLEDKADLVEPLLLRAGRRVDRLHGLPHLRLDGMVHNGRRLTDGPPPHDQFISLCCGGWRVCLDHRHEVIGLVLVIELVDIPLVLEALLAAEEVRDHLQAMARVLKSPGRLRVGVDVERRNAQLLLQHLNVAINRLPLLLHRLLLWHDELEVAVLRRL